MSAETFQLGRGVCKGDSPIKYGRNTLWEVLSEACLAAGDLYDWPR